jgi:hypothetical protein
MKWLLLILIPPWMAAFAYILGLLIQGTGRLSFPAQVAIIFGIAVPVAAAMFLGAAGLLFYIIHP